MTTPQERPGSASEAPQAEAAMVSMRFWVPRRWRDELNDASRERAMSTSDLLRLLVRDFLRRDPPP